MSGDYDSYQHHDAGKCAHEGPIRRRVRRFRERLPLLGGGR